MSFHRHDPNAVPYRYRYVGLKRPGWFRKKVPTWVVEGYTEFAPYHCEMDSTYGYKVLSSWTSEAAAENERDRYLKTHP